MSRAVGALIADDIDIVARLRAVAPGRASTWSEVHAVAERQATMLLRLHHVDAPPVPQFVISSLPGVMVDWKADWPSSGMSVQVDGLWRIVLRSKRRAASDNALPSPTSSSTSSMTP